MVGKYEVVLRAIFLLFVVSLSAGPIGVSAQTHHVVGDESGWGPHLNVSSWVSGRVFRVGDKIWFSLSELDESIAELHSLDDFLSCNLTNPIRMFTDGMSHVTLEKEGVRFFSSGNVESCKNGLKLHVPVEPPPYGPDEPYKPEPFEPEPFKPAPAYGPDEPTPAYEPPEPYKPEPEPFKPEPEYGPPEPYPPAVIPPPPPGLPSASASLNGLYLLFFAGLSLCFVTL